MASVAAGLRALLADGAEHRPCELARALRANVTIVLSALGGYVRRGYVERPRRGVYRQIAPFTIERAPRLPIRRAGKATLLARLALALVRAPEAGLRPEELQAELKTSRATLYRDLRLLGEAGWPLFVRYGSEDKAPHVVRWRACLGPPPPEWQPASSYAPLPRASPKPPKAAKAPRRPPWRKEPEWVGHLSE